MRREYFVVAALEGGGFHSWRAQCDGFWPWSKVNIELLNQWTQYSAIVTGRPSVVVNFQRIRLSARLPQQTFSAPPKPAPVEQPKPEGQPKPAAKAFAPRPKNKKLN